MGLLLFEVMIVCSILDYSCCVYGTDVECLILNNIIDLLITILISKKP